MEKYFFYLNKQVVLKYKSSCSQVLCDNNALKNFAKFAARHPFRCLFYEYDIQQPCLTVLGNQD